jgi:hypothetical protein
VYRGSTRVPHLTHTVESRVVFVRSRWWYLRFMKLGLLTRFTWLGIPLLALASATCGGRGSTEALMLGQCEPASATCLSSGVGQICNQQGAWATFQCGSDQTCADGACMRPGEPCKNGETQCLNDQVSQQCQNERWIVLACGQAEPCSHGHCLATCSPNRHDCVDGSLQRVCLADGSSSVVAECPASSRCQNGECWGACKPSNTVCAAKQIIRECKADGSGYVERLCPPAMSCREGSCVPDDSAACTLGTDLCADEKTVLVCRPDGSGYDVKDCPRKTSCIAGQCMGSVCASGSTSCEVSDVTNLPGVRTCAEDGASFEVSVCRGDEQCVLNKNTGRHECYEPPCTPGTKLCGDPSGKSSTNDRLSRCETLADGKLGWVSYACDKPATCTVTEAGSVECHAECAPGDSRCASDGDAIETCSDDGQWVKKSCNVGGGGSVRVCLVVPTTHKAVCGDPDCVALQRNVQDYKTLGRCSGTQIRKCGEDGRLGKAEDCDEGSCLPGTNGFDTCKDPTRCTKEDGFRECASGKDAYRTCLSNHWEFTLCPLGATCADDGKGRAACGDACDPGDIRCEGPKYQTCSDDGKWGTSRICDVGECNPATKRCETACQPGQIRCAGDVVRASDTTSLGGAAMQTCTQDGSWGAAVACPASGVRPQHCRRSGEGVHLGCVECVGPGVLGGNEEGAIDSRCSADGHSYQTCQSDNTWPKAQTACQTGERCIKQRDGAVKGTCSDDGCKNDTSQLCVGYENLSQAITIDDCCAGECDEVAGLCAHRRSQYDPTCLDTTSCYTGESADGGDIRETCCSGYCVSSQGCLKIKGTACTNVTSCTVVRTGNANICCGGGCQSGGKCAGGADGGHLPEHPASEYFTCGGKLCWGVGSCTWSSAGSGSGAMYADCVEEP